MPFLLRSLPLLAALIVTQPAAGGLLDDVCGPGAPCDWSDWSDRCDGCLRQSGDLFGPNSRGTLFLWPGNSPGDGGPDLDAPLVTDRPDFTEASTPVGRGVSQLEFGYTFVRNDDAGPAVRTHSIGEPLLRAGVLADWLELRIGWNYAAEDSGGDRVDGAEDLYLGFKIGLTPQDGWLPETAIIPQMTVPTGADGFSGERTLPGVNLIYGWEINDRLSTAGSTQVNGGNTPFLSFDIQRPVRNDRFVEVAQSWTVAYAWTDRMSTYTEYFGLYPTGTDRETSVHFLNGGVAYLLSDDVQFDVRYGQGLNDAADDFFVGTGLSIRFR